MAIDQAGSVAGANGSSDDISNSLDRKLLVELRRQSDVIVTTGATARAEKIRRSKFAPIAIVTLTPSIEGYSPELLSPDRAGTASEFSELIFITDATLFESLGATLHATAVDTRVVGVRDLEPKSLLEHLKSAGYQRILLEAGPATAERWLSEGCIDEICLSITGLGSGLGSAYGAGLVGLLPKWFGDAKFEIVSRYFSEANETLFLRLAFI